MSKQTRTEKLEVFKYCPISLVWRGQWNGHEVTISREMVESIRNDEIGEALLVGPDEGHPGMWIATTTLDGWKGVPEVRVWYRYEDFVEYDRAYSGP